MLSRNDVVAIGSYNVGRIAERIVSNELEARGFRVSDLNTGGLSANADLLAAGHQRVWQIQVKGATNAANEGWRVQYGYCSDAVIDRTEPMFNRRSGFYKADIVVLTAVRAPDSYRCVVLPVAAAERAAQLNLDRYYRMPRGDGERRKSGKVWVTLERRPRERVGSTLLEEERGILQAHVNGWRILL